MKKMRTLSSLILTIMVATFSLGPLNSVTAQNVLSIRPSEQNFKTQSFEDLQELNEPIKNQFSFKPLKENIKVSYDLTQKPEEKNEFFQKIFQKMSDNNLSFAREISQDPADLVQDGFDWLLANQLTDGSWTKSGDTGYRDTQAMIELLNWLDETESTNWDLALDWYRLAVTNNLEYSARKIFNMAINEEYTDGLSSHFVTQINPITYGFGYDESYQSDTITTALALKALTESGYTDTDGSMTTIGLTLYNLLTTQNADGGYGYAANEDSEIYPTEIVLDALLAYDGLTLVLETSSGPVEIDITSIIDAALEYLKSMQNTDGSFGESIAESAFAYDLILRRNDYPFDNQGLIDYLNLAQAEDGSFNELDPYATALAVKALAKPDLSVGEITIDTDTPEVDTTITVPITNLGYLDSSPFNLEIYWDGELLTDYEIGATMAHTATLNIEVEFTGGFPVGTYDLEFRVVPSDEISELDPDNNSASITANFSDFDGPLPPEWIGAATSSSSGYIVVTWLPSEDPAAYQYQIYIGTSPGSYSYASSLFDADDIGVRFSGFTVDRTYYFNVIALDASGTRGDYSMESSAIARTTPTQSASMYGYVESDGERVPDAILTLHSFGDEITTDAEGDFSFNIYPGNYYFVASQSGYADEGQGVSLPDGAYEEVIFNLQAVDDGVDPSAVTGLVATPDDGEIVLNWDAQSEFDFDHFNLYRSSTPIIDLSRVSPLDAITDSSAISYTDNTILNGINYYYALTITDGFGNESSDFSSIGPVIGNSAPMINNLTAFMDTDGIVKINYDLSDNENTSFEILLEYFDGSGWQVAESSSGIGNQSSGVSKSISWLARDDFPDQNILTAKIRITANDLQTVNYLSQLESDEFQLDTLSPSAPVLVSFPDYTNETPLSISGTKEANTSVLLDGEEIVPLDTEMTWQYDLNLREGENNITLSSIDAFANESLGAGSAVVLDIVAPIVTVNTLSTNDSTPVVTGTVNEAVDTVSVSVNGQTYSATVFDMTWITQITNVLPDRSYNVSVDAIDLAGNHGFDSTLIELTIDTTAPVITINNLRVSSAPYILTGTVNDRRSTVRITVNGVSRNARVTGNTWRLVITSTLADGIYNVTARAIDSVGNVGVDGTSNELEIDTSPPSAVSGITLLSATDNILIQWSAVTASDLYGYRVYRSETPFTNTGAATLVASTNTATLRYRDRTLVLGQTYYYAVVAVDTLSNALTAVSSVGPVATR